MTNDVALSEIAVGRLYVGAEPEIRVRKRGADDQSPKSLIMTTTVMGEEEAAVGLTASLFDCGSLPFAQAKRQALENVAKRVSSSRGTVLHQEAAALEALPDNVTAYMAIALVKSARTLLPA